MNKLKLIAVIGLTSLVGCQSENPTKKKEVEVKNNIPEINFDVVAKLPHDTSAFTEGFLVHNGDFFESTGSPDNIPFTRSIIGIINRKSGKLEKKIEIDSKKYFGEGMVILKDKIYQLTYQNKIGFIYDLKSFKNIGQFSFQSNEGWGLATDGVHLIMSDGSNVLHFLDPENFNIVKSIKVFRNGFEENNLNELEYINGYIYANIWLKNYIVKIEPTSGEVVGTINLSGIVMEAMNEHPNAEVLNGIAYDKESDKIYITGKLWKSIYQIQFEH